VCKFIFKFEVAAAASRAGSISVFAPVDRFAKRQLSPAVDIDNRGVNLSTVIPVTRLLLAFGQRSGCQRDALGSNRMQLSFLPSKDV
jgi:hypothetical protein